MRKAFPMPPKQRGEKAMVFRPSFPLPIFVLSNREAILSRRPRSVFTALLHAVKALCQFGGVVHTIHPESDLCWCRRVQQRPCQTEQALISEFFIISDWAILPRHVLIRFIRIGCKNSKQSNRTWSRPHKTRSDQRPFKSSACRSFRTMHVVDLACRHATSSNHLVVGPSWSGPDLPRSFLCRGQIFQDQ